MRWRIRESSAKHIISWINFFPLASAERDLPAMTGLDPETAGVLWQYNYV